MPIQPYSYHGPVDHTLATDVSQLKGKSVIITGGANGMGERFVRDFCQAGAFVTFADVHERGKEIEQELNSDGQRVAFVNCDVRDWDQQMRLFERAKTSSPSKSVDIVIANAGISRTTGDSLWNLGSGYTLEPDKPPQKPDLNIVEVNLIGSFYTWKLAVHYFRQQNEVSSRDRCFIITGSMVAYIDSPANWEYTATKYGLLGFMKTARRNSWQQGIRINYVAPCYIKSAIRSAEYERYLTEKGIYFGEQEDCGRCMMRIACDKSINGRSLMIVPRSQAKEGFQDVNLEDWTEDGYMKSVQTSQLNIIDDEWRDDFKMRTYKE